MELGIAVARGHHFVKIERFRGGKGITNKDRVRQYVSDWQLEGFEKCNDINSDSLLRLVKRVLVVTFQSKDKIKQRKDFTGKSLIVIHPEKDKGFEISEESHLITEHFNDGNIFKMIASRHLKQEYGLSSRQLCFFNRNGGGATIKDVFVHERDLKHHLCIFIVDNDMKRPPLNKDDQKENEGDTAKYLREELDKVSDWDESRYDVYFMENVSEIENLIPFAYLDNLGSKHYNIVKNADLSFFDIKKGLQAKYLKDKKTYDHWKSFISTLPQFNEIITKSDSDVIVTGWGKDTIKDFLKECTTKQFTKISDTDLSYQQKKEYDKIGSLIFDWCVAIPPTRS